MLKELEAALTPDDTVITHFEVYAHRAPSGVFPKLLQDGQYHRPADSSWKTAATDTLQAMIAEGTVTDNGYIVLWEDQQTPVTYAFTLTTEKDIKSIRKVHPSVRNR